VARRTKWAKSVYPPYTSALRTEIGAATRTLQIKPGPLSPTTRTGDRVFSFTGNQSNPVSRLFGHWAISYAMSVNWLVINYQQCQTITARAGSSSSNRDQKQINHVS
jgi:hypothetical protein